jgi:hypothetical protein
VKVFRVVIDDDKGTDKDSDKELDKVLSQRNKSLPRLIFKLIRVYHTVYIVLLFTMESKSRAGYECAKL